MSVSRTVQSKYEAPMLMMKTKKPVKTTRSQNKNHFEFDTRALETLVESTAPGYILYIFHTNEATARHPVIHTTRGHTPDVSRL